jgi:transcriptional regulator with XRE-family HTH domain
MNEQDIFIRNLKNLMIERKLNQKELAEKLGMAQPSVYLVLSQKNKLSMGFALKVCDAFNVTMQQMFTPDPKQFGIVRDMRESNKEAIMQMQKEQIAQLEEENAKLRKEISLYDFKQDDLNVVEKEMVNHPDHYNQGKYECIDEMLGLFGVKTVISFCKCNIYKYKTRASHKNGEEDLAKADWYMDKLLELQGENK